MNSNTISDIDYDEVDLIKPKLMNRCKFNEINKMKIDNVEKYFNNLIKISRLNMFLFYYSFKIYILTNSELNKIIKETQITNLPSIVLDDMILSIKISIDEKFIVLNLKSGIYIYNIDSFLSKDLTTHSIYYDTNKDNPILDLSLVINNDIYLIFTDEKKLKCLSYKSNFELKNTSDIPDIKHFTIIDNHLITTTKEEILFISYQNNMKINNRINLKDLLGSRNLHIQIISSIFKGLLCIGVLEQQDDLNTDNLNQIQNYDQNFYFIYYDIKLFQIKFSNIFKVETLFFPDENITNWPKYTVLFYPELQFVFISSSQSYVVELFIIDKLSDNKITRLILEGESQIITPRNRELDKMTFPLGISIIDFKFDGYNQDKTVSNSMAYFSPPLFIVLNDESTVSTYYIFNDINENCILKYDNNKGINFNCKELKIHKPKIEYTDNKQEFGKKPEAKEMTSHLNKNNFKIETPLQLNKNNDKKDNPIQSNNIINDKLQSPINNSFNILNNGHTNKIIQEEDKFSKPLPETSIPDEEELMKERKLQYSKLFDSFILQIKNQVKLYFNIFKGYSIEIVQKISSVSDYLKDKNNYLIKIIQTIEKLSEKQKIIKKFDFNAEKVKNEIIQLTKKYEMIKKIFSKFQLEYKEEEIDILFCDNIDIINIKDKLVKEYKYIEKQMNTLKDFIHYLKKIKELPGLNSVLDERLKYQNKYCNIFKKFSNHPDNPNFDLAIESSIFEEVMKKLELVFKDIENFSYKYNKVLNEIKNEYDKKFNSGFSFSYQDIKKTYEKVKENPAAIGNKPFENVYLEKTLTKKIKDILPVPKIEIIYPNISKKDYESFFTKRDNTIKHNYLSQNTQEYLDNALKNLKKKIEESKIEIEKIENKNKQEILKMNEVKLRDESRNKENKESSKNFEGALKNDKPKNETLNVKDSKMNLTKFQSFKDDNNELNLNITQEKDQDKNREGLINNNFEKDFPHLNNKPDLFSLGPVKKDHGKNNDSLFNNSSESLFGKDNIKDNGGSSSFIKNNDTVINSVGENFFNVVNIKDNNNQSLGLKKDDKENKSSNTFPFKDDSKKIISFVSKEDPKKDNILFGNIKNKDNDEKTDKNINEKISGNDNKKESNNGDLENKNDTSKTLFSNKQGDNNLFSIKFNEKDKPNEESKINFVKDVKNTDASLTNALPIKEPSITKQNQETKVDPKINTNQIFQFPQITNNGNLNQFTNQQNTNQQNTNQQNTNQQNTNQQNTNQQNTNQQNTNQQNTNQQNTNQQNTNQQNTNQLNTNQLNTNQLNTNQLNTNQQNTNQQTNLNFKFPIQQNQNISQNNMQAFGQKATISNPLISGNAAFTNVNFGNNTTQTSGFSSFQQGNFFGNQIQNNVNQGFNTNQQNSNNQNQLNQKTNQNSQNQKKPQADYDLFS